MEDAFKTNTFFKVSATDIPNLKNVKSTANMFENCNTLNTPLNINFWDMSNVTNVSGMFKGCTQFNQALSQWNTTNITNMSSLFEGAGFNQNIGTWDTSNVTNMSKMFKKAGRFNRNIGNWNTDKVIDMSEMFSDAVIFNQNIGNWNTLNVTDMSFMFIRAYRFNQDIGNWNTSNVTDMSHMFSEALAFNQNIGHWNTSKVKYMSRMFGYPKFSQGRGTSLFNNGGDSSIENWDTSKVVDMSGMFFKAINFNHNLGNWSLKNTNDLTFMLDESGIDCTNYTKTLIDWNNNPDTPNNIILGATYMQYFSEITPIIENFMFEKAWGFSGHDIVSTIPEFSIENNYCEGETIPALPNISSDGITGVWTPELDASKTTTYTFTPNTGECAKSTTLTIFINTKNTLADVIDNPSSFLWYATLEDAVASINELSLDLIIGDGKTYYAVNKNGECKNTPLAVLMSFTLSTNDSNFISLKYYPNPVTTILYISNQTPIHQVEIYNLIGQSIFKKNFNTSEVSIDLKSLPKSLYILHIKSGSQSNIHKIVKR